ncbi:MAG TPA: hypothetical protein VFJ62_11630 [Usitatibacter sp.]|nr:hypothetical protein [Usitatibacter sp.]
MNARSIRPILFSADPLMEAPRPSRSETPACEPPRPRRTRTAEEIILDASERSDAPSNRVLAFHVVVTLALIALAAWFALG